MHEDEKYLDSLYCIQDKIMKDAEEFAKNPDNLQGKGLDYFDTLMHMAKNLRKEIWAEEGKYDDMYEEYYSGDAQGENSGLRAEPGRSYEGGSRRSMRGGSMRSMRGGGYSGKRDSRGRYTSRGSSYHGSDDMIGKLREKAERMSDREDRERMLRLIEWIDEDQQ